MQTRPDLVRAGRLALTTGAPDSFSQGDCPLELALVPEKPYDLPAIGVFTNPFLDGAGCV